MLPKLLPLGQTDRIWSNFFFINLRFSFFFGCFVFNRENKERKKLSFTGSTSQCRVCVFDFWRNEMRLVMKVPQSSGSPYSPTNLNRRSFHSRRNQEVTGNVKLIIKVWPIWYTISQMLLPHNFPVGLRNMWYKRLTSPNSKRYIE